MEIVGQSATKWTPTKSDMQTYCRTLSVDPHGDVTSRLVSFMERVDDVIDENGLRQQLKDSTMLRTFVKVVAARVTPSYLRDRVEGQMKTVPANNLVAFAAILREQLDRPHDADMVNQQRNSYGSKRGREEDDQGRRITQHAKKANQAVRDQRNYEAITHVHQVDTSSRNEVRRFGPRRHKSERGTHQPQSTDRRRTRAQDMMIAMSKLCVMKHALDLHPAGMTAACCA
ncbi:hypothetical protein DYB28_005432, partial [Aphanomyces astaci]